MNQSIAKHRYSVFGKYDSCPLVNNKKVAPGINVEGPGGQQTEVFDQDKGTKRGSIQFRNVGKRDQKTIISLFLACSLIGIQLFWK